MQPSEDYRPAHPVPMVPADFPASRDVCVSSVETCVRAPFAGIKARVMVPS
jgi:hypothetical protein